PMRGRSTAASALAVDGLVAVEECIDVLSGERFGFSEGQREVHGAGDVLAHHGRLDRLARRGADREDAVVQHQHGGRGGAPRRRSSVSTTPRPISSFPIRANGPTGISPPNSSAIAVSTQGIDSPRAANAVAYGLCVCATPPTSGRWR